MRGDFLVETAHRGVGQERVQSLVEFDMRELGAPVHAGEPWGQPAFRSFISQGGKEGFVAHVRPFGIFAFTTAHEHDAGLPLAEFLAPRKAGETETGYAFEHGRKHGFRRQVMAAQGRIFEDEGIQKQAAASQYGFGTLVPEHAVFTAQTWGVELVDISAVQRCGKVDAPRSRTASVHRGDSKEGSVCEGVFGSKHSAATGGKAERTSLSPLGYAFRPCETEECPGEAFIAQGFVQGEAALRYSEGVYLFSGLAQTGIATELAESGAQVASCAGTAFFGECGDGGGQRGVLSGRKDHVGKARMQGQARQLFAVRRELGAAVLFLHGSQKEERLQGLRNRGFRRRREEGQILRE